MTAKPLLRKSDTHPQRGIRSDQRVATVLTIAGSDSGGCAGLQADLAAIAAYGLHGACAVTAVTAQDTRRLTAVHPIPGAIVAAQLAAVFGDFDVRAVKTGMLAGAGTVRQVAAALRRFRPPALVVDPVLVSTSGAPLLSRRALGVMRRELLPLATLLTPNLPEAETLLGRPIRSLAEQQRAARDLLAFGPAAVLLKGGHGHRRTVVDVFDDGTGQRTFSHARRPGEVRGTGCTLASAVAAGLASGLALATAVERAESHLQALLARAARAGRGAHRSVAHLRNKSTKS